MKDFSSLKKQMDKDMVLQSNLHSHEDKSNWVESTWIADTSETARTEDPTHHRKTKLTRKECPDCGMPEIYDAPLESTKPKEEDKPTYVNKKKSWF